MPLNKRGTSRLGLVLLSAAAVSLACERPTGSDEPLAPDPAAFTSSSSCGASFTMISHEEDEVAGQYGSPTSDDTVTVCETWTGNDYNWSFRTIGSSEDYTSVPDNVQSVTYQSGYATAYSRDGAQVEAPEYVAANLFDFVRADEAQRQASYDDPYYGVYSGGCADPSQLQCEAMARTPLATAVPDPGKFMRHGIKRLGVRALVDDKDEIAPSPEGYRRFRKVRGEETLILSVHPITQLLVGEEAVGPRGATTARHTWKLGLNGWVRDRTEIEATEIVNGRTFRSRATLRFLDVRVQ